MGRQCFGRRHHRIQTTRQYWTPFVIRIRRRSISPSGSEGETLEHLEQQQTYDDRGAYGRPWTITLNLELDPDNEILEYFCNENEWDLVHRVPHGHVAVLATVLAGYAGTYQTRTDREITITLEDDQ